jgi:signal transduction histidine kinase
MAADRLDPGQELDALASALAHDLRAPLRAIDGFSRILLADQDGALPEDTRRYLELVRDAGTELAELLDDLVAIARVAQVEMVVREVEPAELARELVDAVLAPRVPEGRAVEWVVEDGVPAVAADRALVRRLLEELLDNALKFGAARVTFGWDASEGAYRVSDDGIGFDGVLPAQALEIFGRLNGREEHPGTGAGLALATRIVARHGGRLWGAGVVGEGATIWFTLEA